MFVFRASVWFCVLHLSSFQVLMWERRSCGSGFISSQHLDDAQCSHRSYSSLMCTVYNGVILAVHTINLFCCSILCTWHLLLLCPSWNGSLLCCFSVFSSDSRVSEQNMKLNRCQTPWCKFILGYFNKVWLDFWHPCVHCVIMWRTESTADILFFLK